MKTLFQISTHERRGLMEDCYLLYLRLGLGLCKNLRVYIVSWEKTEQNWICRFWERSAPNWERPVPTPLCFLTATTLHDLGSRLSTGNSPCSLGNGPSPPETARPRWHWPAANHPSSFQCTSLGILGTARSRLGTVRSQLDIYTLYINQFLSLIPFYYFI